MRGLRPWHSWAGSGRTRYCSPSSIPTRSYLRKNFSPDYQNGDVLARLMADRAEQDGEFKAELFRLANGDLPPGKRMPARKNIFALSGRGRFGGRPLRAARRRFGFSLRTSPVDRERILGAAPASDRKDTLTLLRREDRMHCENVFSRWRKRIPTGSDSAFALLGQIEVWRLEDGRPMDEPRHPAIESGFPWPI